MPISIACKDCGSKYKVADTMAGKKVKCKKCGNVLAIPALVPAVSDDGPALRFRDDDEPTAAPVARKPRPVAKPPAGRPAPAKPQAARGATPARPKPAPVKRPPPPSDENSLEDLAALAHGDLLPPEELPMTTAAAAPVYRAPAAAPARGHAPQIGYATPRPQIQQQADYISANGGFLIAALFFSMPIRAIISVIATVNHPEFKGTVNYGALAFGLLLGTALGGAIICLFIAPILLVGIKVAGKIMKFATDPGGYKNVLMMLGWPSALGVIATLLQLMLRSSPEAMMVVAVITLVLGLAGMVRILKDSFGINWAQTAVAAAMAIGSTILTIVFIAVMIASAFGGMARLIDKVL